MVIIPVRIKPLKRSPPKPKARMPLRLEFWQDISVENADPSASEAMLQTEFPRYLETLIRRTLTDERKGAFSTKKTDGLFSVSNIRYGSLTFDLGVLNSKEFFEALGGAELVLSVLSHYVPVAFAETFNLPLGTIEVEVRPPIGIKQNETKSLLVDRAWLITNLSLVVPVVLALLVLKVAHEGLVEERNGMRSEQALFRAFIIEALKLRTNVPTSTTDTNIVGPPMQVKH